MKRKSNKLLSILIVLAMLLGLFAAMPLAAYAADGPIKVTLQPVGATYLLNEAAIPLKATFSYDASAAAGYIDPETKMYVKWYWSYDNSNTSRMNGLGGSEVAYGRQFDHTTTQVPATDAYGVKYYYAVLTYAESVHNGTEWVGTPKEAVTNPARIEVKPRTHGFEVRKVDTAGNPLAGAVMALTSTSDPAKSYTETSAADGFVQFNVEEGTYILSEKQAPAGYKGSADTYYILITQDGVNFDNPSTKTITIYQLITFVNERIAVPGLKEFTVKKTDEDGKALAGAVIRLEGKNDDGTPRVYNETTNSSGEAVFKVENGTYDLFEWSAPAGYNATDDKYKIVVTANGVFFDKVTHMAHYEAVTFVNKKIPDLNKFDHFAYMQGYPEGTFYQTRNMTRAEAVVMFSRLLAKAMNLNTDYKNAAYYPDISLKAWYANQVCYMYSLGVLADFSRDGRFRPNDPVTRAEFATLASHFENLELKSENKFTDVPASHWAVKYINSAAAKGWIAGYPDNTFKPEANITRAEVVTLVNRMLERKADKNFINANINNLPRSYSDLKSTYWAYWDILEASMGHNYTKDSLGNETWTSFYK